jgi:hypothetical protein
MYEPDDDGQNNFGKYSQVELENALLRIDREQYPKNYSELLNEIARRKETGRWNEMDTEFRRENRRARILPFLSFLILVPVFYVLNFVLNRWIDDQKIRDAFIFICFGFILLWQAWTNWKVANIPCPKCHKRMGRLGGRGQGSTHWQML